MDRRLLRVDLTRGTCSSEDIPEIVLQQYIGGKGLAAYYCYKEIPPGIDALAPGNKLMFFVGPLTGVFNVYSRHVAAAKSPQTGMFCDGYAGGCFGEELAKAGYMGIIFEGRAERLSLLRIEGMWFNWRMRSIWRGNLPTKWMESIGIPGQPPSPPQARGLSASPSSPTPA